MKPRCAILDDYQNVALTIADWTPMADRVDVRVFNRHFDTDDELVAAIEDCAIVVAMRERTPFPRALLARLPSLKLLVTTGMRNASIDVAAAADHGVVVCGTPTSGQPAAELTWALILALLRRLPQEHGGVPRRWRMAEHDRQRPRGQAARRHRPGQARHARRRGRQSLRHERRGVEPESDRGPLRRGERDVRHVARCAARVIGHRDAARRPVGPDARALGERELNRMKPTAILINTSRGPLVDEPALIAALSAGTIAGAGLDVFDVEPLPPGHPFRSLPNVVATPHLGYVTAENYRTLYAGAVADIVAWLDGRPIRVILGHA